MTQKKKIILSIGAVLVGSCAFAAGVAPLKPADVAPLTDGVYAGKAGGHHGSVQVAVIVQKGKIYRVEVTRHKEKRSKEMKTIARRILAKQSVKVDAISGATLSSKAVMNATKNALDQARKK
jgi:uncharacterized protein with FMN-binding domain